MGYGSAKLAGTDEAEPSAEESPQADKLAHMVSELLPEKEAEEKLRRPGVTPGTRPSELEVRKSSGSL